METRNSVDLKGVFEVAGLTTPYVPWPRIQSLPSDLRQIVMLEGVSCQLPRDQVDIGRLLRADSGLAFGALELSSPKVPEMCCCGTAGRASTFPHSAHLDILLKHKKQKTEEISV